MPDKATLESLDLIFNGGSACSSDGGENIEFEPNVPFDKPRPRGGEVCRTDRLPPYFDLFTDSGDSMEREVEVGVPGVECDEWGRASLRAILGLCETAGEYFVWLLVGDAGRGMALAGGLVPIGLTALNGLVTLARALAGVALLLTLAFGRIIVVGVMDRETVDFMGEGGRYGEGTLFVGRSLYESFEVTFDIANLSGIQ